MNLVPDSVYDMQSAFYPTVQNKFGVPLDTRHDETKSMHPFYLYSTCYILVVVSCLVLSFFVLYPANRECLGDWQTWAAAIASESTRDMFFKNIVLWINETPTSRPMTDLYDTVTGGYPGIYFIARPVVGGAFAPLLLQ